MKLPCAPFLLSGLAVPGPCRARARARVRLGTGAWAFLQDMNGWRL